MAPKRQRIRRKARSTVQSAQKKKKSDTPATIASLRKRIAAMEVNTSPFGATGGTIGRSVGGFFGNPNVGQQVGSWLGSGIGKIFGSGAYKMRNNSIWSTSDQCPVMHSTSESVVLRHREYITDVNSSTSFVNTEFAINPGLPGTFPFLAAIASNFQEYSFRGLVFEFKSTSADALNSTNTALGTIAMAIQYRANATTFATKQDILNEMWSADAKPSNSFFMPVECSPAECPMDIQYVRSGSLASSDDIKFYDLGKLSVSSVGSQAAAVVGELWASYEVVLRKPILGGGTGIDTPSATLFRTGVGTTTNLFGSDTAYGSNSIGVTFPSSNVFTLPKGSLGKYSVSVSWVSAVGVTVAPVITVATNVTYVTVNGNSYIAGTTSANGGYMALQTWFRLTDPESPASVTITGTFVNPSYCYFTVAQLDYDTVST